MDTVAANVLNSYSGTLSFTAMDIKLVLALRRALVALTFGVMGYIVALTGLHDAGGSHRPASPLSRPSRVLDPRLARPRVGCGSGWFHGPISLL